MNPSPVTVRRNSKGSFTAFNARGAQVKLGRPTEGDDFSPVELLMAALGGCAGLSADNVLSRRLGEDAPVTVHVEGDKDVEGNRLTKVRMHFELDLSELNEADAARLAETVAKAVERSCTVSRTVEPGLPVDLLPLVEPEPATS